MEVFYVKQSEITLIEALSMLDSFAPIKISLNGILLYNDYDSEVEAEPGVFGEVKPWQEVVMTRLWQSKDYIITDISIKVVDFHHSIISMRGRYEPYKKGE
jgi:hypothetical protein